MARETGRCVAIRRHNETIIMNTTDTTNAPSSVAPSGTSGMVRIPGGTFRMGSDAHYPEEAPAHQVTVNPFWMDRHAVTNTDFRRFVDATGHVTLAERPANPDDYPGAKPELLAPSSVMFRKSDGPVDLRNHYNWWIYVQGADWRHPRGPASSLQGLWKHPVVHVAYEDAEAYAFRTKADAPEIDGVTYVDSDDEIAEGTIAKLEILGGEGHEMVGALVED